MRRAKDAGDAVTSREPLTGNWLGAWADGPGEGFRALSSALAYKLTLVGYWMTADGLAASQMD